LKGVLLAMVQRLLRIDASRADFTAHDLRHIRHQGSTMNDIDHSTGEPLEVVTDQDSGARYAEFFVGMHGALLTQAPGLGDAIDRLARDTPVSFGKAAWGYDLDQARGWLQTGIGTTAAERAAAAAEFDRDMRRRGLVPIAPEFLR
jgi:hypothetical protein